MGGGALAALAVLFVGMTVLSQHLFRGVRLDLTEHRLYTVTPGTRRITGRAMSKRSTSKPIAARTDTNMTHRATRSCGVAAVAETLGTGNCGAGPGFGPTA